jgi:hypothetical protein
MLHGQTAAQPEDGLPRRLAAARNDGLEAAAQPQNGLGTSAVRKHLSCCKLLIVSVSIPF